MQLVFHSRIDDFLATSGKFLESNEAINNLILGLCSHLRISPEPKTIFGSFINETGVTMAFLQTPSSNLVLSRGADEVIPELVRRLHLKRLQFPGVVGPSDLAEAFSNQWSHVSGRLFRLVANQRIYQLEKVIPPPVAEGFRRLATASETPLIKRWLTEFILEALPTEFESEDRLAQMADRGVQSGRFHVWEQRGEVVAMAGLSGPTRYGIRINCVYTPEALRGHGLAANLVASLSQHALDSGRRYCFLYTDLSNPTSNRIYQRIGYQPVADSRHFQFLK